MALHEQSVGKSDEWYTPPYVFDALGEHFDVDVASPSSGIPWIPTWGYIYDRSLERDWRGFVWMNPPFGGRNGIVPWLEKFFNHGDGIALAPDRTSAPWWQKAVRQADATLFVGRKIHFIPGPGAKASSPAQGTTLMAAGKRGVQALANAERNGLGVLMTRPLVLSMAEAA